MKKKVPVRGRTPHANLALAPAQAPWELVVIDADDVRIAGRVENPRIVIWTARGKALSVTTTLGPELSLAESFAEAVGVYGGRPTEVRVGDAALAAAVQAVAGAGVTVSVGASPEARALAQRLLDGLSPIADFAKIDAFLAFLRAPKELVDSFVRNALALAAVKPWEIVTGDSDAFEVHTPGLAPPTSTVLITGQLGESYAALVFDSFEDFAAFQDVAAEAAGGRPRSLPSFHAISFDRADEVAPEISARLKRAGYPVAWRGFIPLPMFTERPDAPSAVMPGALLRLTVIADALQQFFTRHGSAVRADPDAPIRHEGSARVQGALRPWVVAYPHPAYADDAEAVEGDAKHPVAAVLAWVGAFAAAHPEAVRDAQAALARTRKGRAVTPREVAKEPLNETSLARHWAATTRITPDGRDPLTLAGTLRDLPTLAAERMSVIEAQRVILGEVVDARDDEVLVEDLVDGRRYTVVGIPHAQGSQLRRWCYILLQIVPLDGDRWTYVSLLTAAERFTEDLAPAFEAAMRAELRAAGRRVEEGGGLGALLKREMGVAHAVLMKLSEEARARPRRRYFENSDGDRVEFITLTVALPGTPASIRAAFDAMPELMPMKANTWSWLDRARTKTLPGGESLAVIIAQKRGCRVEVNSPARAAQALALLRARFGEEVFESKREVVAPWRKYPDTVAEKGEGVEVQVIANGPVTASSDEAPISAEEMVERHLMRTLDEHVPMLGGVPREMVKTAEGRVAVERWLRGFESRALPGADGMVSFDADPMRRALGLTPIRAS